VSLTSPTSVAARLVLGLSLLLPACGVLPTLDFQRMINQAKYKVWQPSADFDDGRVMRTPPAGTLPRGTRLGDPAVNEGMVAGAYVTDLPVPLTAPSLRAGRDHFEIHCAPCHGVRGDGDSVVAVNMDLRRPPPLAGAGARALPAGKIYQIIDHGYGLMRSYAQALPTPEDRWAVVAYLQALRLSHGVTLSALPPGVRRAAEEQLP
jgi:mono/diheme cytochrome c family protein